MRIRVGLREREARSPKGLASRRNPGAFMPWWCLRQQACKFIIVYQNTGFARRLSGGIMDIKQLEYFLQVYEDGSFSRAAGHLFITQQGLNKAIQKLEKELHSQLFLRTNHGLIPTEAGRLLKKQAVPYISQWSDILQSIKQSDNITDHTLRIGFDIGMLGLTPPGFFPTYMNRHPNEDIQLINLISDSRRLLLNNELDVVFCQAPIDTDLFQDVFAVYYPVTLAAHADHPLAQKESVCIADLRGYRVMDFSLNSPAQTYYQTACKSAGVKITVLLNASQGTQIANFVSRNAAVSFFAGDPAWLPHPIRTIPFSDMQISSGYHMITKKGHYLGLLVQDFIQAYRTTVSLSVSPLQ